jgi:hypothetical protein
MAVRFCWDLKVSTSLNAEQYSAHTKILETKLRELEKRHKEIILSE